MKNIFKLFAFAAIALMGLASCAGNGGENSAEAVLNNIHSRKSVRSFTSQPVSADQVETLLRAAMAAPTGMNVQPWSFVVIQDRAELDALAEVLPYAKMLKQSPLAIVVCGETTWRDNENPYWQQDCAAATENLLLAAEAIGLGAVWTGVYPNEQLYPKLHEYLGLPENVQPFCAIPIGYPAGNDQPKDKWKPEKIHYGKW